MPIVFQYGSNCDEARLNGASRLNGGAKDLGRARTMGSYEIAFNKWSEGNKCAAADLISRRRAGHAWGVLYEVSLANLERLATIEGPSYRPKRISVRDVRGSRLVVTTFVVRPERRESKLATSAEYVGHIAHGLTAHGVPKAYIRRVVAIANRSVATRSVGPRPAA